MGHAIEALAAERGHVVTLKLDKDDPWPAEMDADVAIEFTMPATAVGNMLRCLESGVPVVCGTTGWYAEYEKVVSECRRRKGRLFTATNFSIGMNIMFLLNKQLAKFAEQYGYQLSMAETHHIHKLDKPSGTAVKLANDILSVNYDYDRWSIEAPAEHTLYIKVTREGEVSGMHSVMAESPADKITLTHEAFNRQGFALGAVAAAEFLIGKTGVFGMEDLFGT